MVQNKVFHKDCMIGMGEYEDKHFDLAIVDPEFGIGIGHSSRLVKDKNWVVKDWDNEPIDEKYFDELFRVSKNQIIWGAYYQLPPSKHLIVWDKLQPESLSFGMFDCAWTSFDKPNKMFRLSVQKRKNKIHPTQKPVLLYNWILKNYAKENDKILDTHLGSGSSRIAAHKLGFDFIGFEIDKEYFEKANLRFLDEIKMPIFDKVEVENLSLF